LTELDVNINIYCWKPWSRIRRELGRWNGRCW